MAHVTTNDNILVDGKWHRLTIVSSPKERNYYVDGEFTHTFNRDTGEIIKGTGNRHPNTSIDV